MRSMLCIAPRYISISYALKLNSNCSSYNAESILRHPHVRPATLDQDLRIDP